MHPKFRFEDAPGGATRFLVPSGDLDATGAAALRESVEAALSAGKRLVVVDLSETNYAETAVIAALLDGNARARRFGARLCVVVDPGSRIQSLFATTRLNRVLRVVASRQTAIDPP